MNKLVLAGLAMSTAMAVGAQAEPLILSGDQLDKVSAAGQLNILSQVQSQLQKVVNIQETVNVNKTVNSAVATFGNLAMANSDANCSHGFFGCVAQTATATDTNFNGTGTTGFWDATSHSQALSATGSPFDRIAFEANGNGNDTE